MGLRPKYPLGEWGGGASKRRPIGAGHKTAKQGPRNAPQQPYITPRIHHKMNTRKNARKPAEAASRAYRIRGKRGESHTSPSPNDNLVRPIVARTVVVTRRRRRRIPAAELRIGSHRNARTQPVQLSLRHSRYIRRLRQVKYQDRLRRQ
jgi:hypothetical protein